MNDGITEAYRGTYQDRSQTTKKKNNKNIVKELEIETEKMNIFKHTLLALLIPITTFLACKAITYFRPSLETFILITNTSIIILFVFVIYLLNKIERD